MCLNVTSRIPKRIRFKNGRVTLYKRLSRLGNKIVSPVMDTIYHSGYNIATGTPSKYSSIEAGAIHVYTSKRKVFDLTYSFEIIMPVTCYKKDFIAEGTHSEACFTKVFISKKNYAKALRSKSKYDLVER